MDYSYKFQNRQIPLKTIENVANYLEILKEEYNKKFEIDDRKNESINYGERNYEYGKGESKLIYEIEYENGTNIKEENYNWFIANINPSKKIKYIGINFSVHFYTTKQDMRKFENKCEEYNNISIVIRMEEDDGRIFANTTRQENNTNKYYNDIINMFNNNEERYNKTIKHRNIRRFCFCTTIGIILSYIIYFILKINMNVFPKEIESLLNNKIFIVLGQWIMAISCGHLFSSWYISSLYIPIIPPRYYVGNNKYEDSIELYVRKAEVHIGRYWDAGIRRRKIEILYKYCKKIVLIQLILSFIFIVVLK